MLRCLALFGNGWPLPPIMANTHLLNRVGLFVQCLATALTFKFSYPEAEFRRRRHCFPDHHCINLSCSSDIMSSTTSYLPDPHAVSAAESQAYYAGLPSEPILIYRTGKEQWSPPRGPEAYRRLKELREVFNHSITKVWHDGLAWKVVSVLDKYKVS